jgi:SAM-dependent methyltransferase
MFPRLAAFLKDPRLILDIGCGYGIPSVWLLELFPAATVACIDPDGERVRVAGRALGRQGEARTGRAPGIGGLPAGADTALILDVIHMLDDGELRETLAILHAKLVPGGRLVIRATMPEGGGRPWLRRIEELRLKRHRLSPRYRSREVLEMMIRNAGFAVGAVEPAAPLSGELWFVADRRASREGSP